MVKLESWLILKFINLCKNINADVTNDVAYRALKMIRENRANVR